MSSEISPHGGKKFLIAAANLRRDLKTGVFNVGDRLPRPEVLAPRYGVSKTTMEKAIGVLKNDGLLIAYTGDGTYVQDHPVQPQAETDAEAYKEIMVSLADLHDAVSDLRLRLDRIEEDQPADPPQT